MSRSHKDKPGGHTSRLYCGPGWIRYAKRHARQQARAKAKHNIRNDREPQPIYPEERAYID